MRAVLIVLLLVLVIAAALAGYGGTLYKTPSSNTSPVSMMVEKGQSSRTIAQNLADQNLVSNKWVFLLAWKAGAGGKSLKAGEYEIASRSSMKDVIDQIVSGRVVQRQVTIPEGKTSFEVVALVNAAKDLAGDLVEIPPEGTLLPDTYNFTKDETKSDVIARMSASMEKVKASLWDGRDPNLPFTTWEEAVTLASIVEKETGVASERKRIAGVFINRLRQGMPLQSDPTVIYALTAGKPKNDGQGPLGRRLLSKDLDTASPYNTYRNAGLPPGPIANPGRDALDAVLHPESNSYLYFVADGTGGHVFAGSLAEHNRNVQDWRKIRNSQESGKN